MPNCPVCGTGVDNANAATVAEIILREFPWNDVCEYDDDDEFSLPSLGSVTMLVNHARNIYDSYGDVVTSDIFVIFRYRDLYFRRNGTADSYDGLRWEGEVEPVTPRTKVVYEYI